MREEGGTAADVGSARCGAPIWCPGCSRAIEAALRALPRDVALLALEMDHGTASAGRERVSGTRPRRLHDKEALSFLRDAVYDTLVSWELDVRETREFSAMRRRSWGKQIEHSAHFLTTHLEWLLESHPSPEATTEFGREILDLHRRVQRAVRADDPPVRKCEGVRCPKCQLKALAWEQEADGSATGYVACRGCGILLSEAEYQEVVSQQARGTRKLVRRA